MDSFQLLLKSELIVVGTILIPEGIMIAAYSDDYVFAIYSVWLVFEFVVLSVIKSKAPKWILALIASAGITAFFIWYEYTSEPWDYDLEMVLVMVAVYFTPLYPLSLLTGWISKEKAKEAALTKYKNDKNILRTLERDIDGKQQLLNQQNRLLEITALLNACGSSTVSIQKNQNYKRAEDIKTQLAELEAQRAKIEFSIEAYEEGKAQQSA